MLCRSMLWYTAVCDAQITCCLSQLKEEERKRKALTAKLQEEQRRKQQFVAKKKEKEREEEATIRERLLSESSIEAPEVKEVEEYITTRATLETEVSAQNLHAVVSGCHPICRTHCTVQVCKWFSV